MSHTQAQHVLHVRVVAGKGGGPDKTILRSAGYVDPQRYAMTCVYLYPQNDPGIEVIRNTAESFGAKLITIPERGAIVFSAVREILKVCREKQVTIWHGHDYKSDALGLLLRRFHPMKLVTTAHGFTRETLRTKLYYHVDNLAMRSYDHIITVSPPLLEHARSLGIANDNITYIPNAIEPAEYVFKKRNTHARRIGVIGRFSVEKGVDRAIETLAKLNDVTLHLVGDGPQREQLETLAQQHGVMDAITWHGWQTDVRPFYEKFDLLLLPSHTEGLPNVVLEAMALGVPVAATDVGGVRDLLDNGRLGTILDPRDTSKWAQKIEHELSQPHDTILARQWIESHYSFASRMRQVTDVYDKLMQPSVLQRAA